jgi:hypothetical protein
MRSLNEIVAESNRYYRQAKRDKAQPYIAKKDGDEGVFKAPFLGPYLPKGWQKVDCHFVDSSGFGQDGEAALSIRKFLSIVKEGYGYSIREAGQFQVYINEFKRED